jgi:hypothetical protein
MAYVPPHMRSQEASAPAASGGFRRFAALEEPPKETASRWDSLASKPAPRPAFQEPLPSPPVEMAPVTTASAEPISHLDWLAQARKGYTPKTAQEIKAELDNMTFKQLHARAGPPPTVSGCSFFNVQDGEGNSGGARNESFDSSLYLYKKMQGPPPIPLDHDKTQSDWEGLGGKDVKAYCRWYDEWGTRLTIQWKKEHSMPELPKKTTVRTTTIKKEEDIKINRNIPDAGPKSGW